MPLPLLLIPLAAGAAKASAVGTGIYVAGGVTVTGATGVGVSWWNGWRWWDPEWYREQKQAQAPSPTPDTQETARAASTLTQLIPSEPKLDTLTEVTANATEADGVEDDVGEPIIELPIQERAFAVEDIADSTIEVLQLKKALKNLLKAWMISELSKHQPLINRLPPTLNLNIDNLARQLSDEIRYSLNEHGDIREAHQQDIYKARVIIGFQNWFFEDHRAYLTPEEIQLHEWSQEMRNELAIQRARTKDSRKGKQSIERLLILRTALAHKEKEEILKQAGDSRKSFISSVAKQKYKSEGTHYNGISRNINKQKAYIEALNTVITQELRNLSLAALPRANAAPTQGPLSPTAVISLDGESMEINPGYELSEKQTTFINIFTAQFHDLYAKFHLIRNREVRRLTDNTDKGMAMATQVGGALLQASAMSEGKIAAGNLLLHVIQSIIIAKKDRDAEVVARRMEDLLPLKDGRARMKIIERVGQSIAIRYQNQLAKFASDTDIETFAECVAARITEYVTRDDNHQYVPNTHSFFHSRFTSSANDRQRENPGIIMIKGLIDGTYKELDEKPIRISGSNKPWTPKNIIQSTGIVVRGPYGLTLYTRTKTPQTDDKTALRYGCCYGCIQEAQNRGYQAIDASRTTLNLGVLLDGSPWHIHEAVADEGEGEAAAAAAAPRPRAMR